jgi:cysteine desulfuration protein SufE
MPIPPRLQQVVDVMRSAPKEFRVEALLDFSNRVPSLPDGMAADELEQVHECQTPFFLATTVDDDGTVHMFFEAPRESPTVRGFAGILHHGLEGEQATTVLEVPDDFYVGMGLEEVVTPLRLRGMGAILARLKRQVREALATGDEASA